MSRMTRLRFWWHMKGGKELCRELWYRTQMLIFVTLLAILFYEIYLDWIAR